MKKIYLFLWVVLLVYACQTTPQHITAANPADTVNYVYKVKPAYKWLINPNHENVAVALNALKAYELGDTARLKKCLADTITVYYNGGKYNGSNSEFMYAINENFKQLKNLRIKVKDWQSVKTDDGEQQRVTTWYTQYWLNAQGKPDSADAIDDARFKDGKIVVWYDYIRNYK